MKHLAQAYNSFLWATAASVALFSWTWLEMRVNIGLIFFALIALLALMFVITDRGFGTRFTLASLFLCAAAVSAFAGAGRVFALPAIIMREGLGMTRTPLAYFGYAAALIVLLGGAAVLLPSYSKRSA